MHTHSTTHKHTKKNKFSRNVRLPDQPYIKYMHLSCNRFKYIFFNMSEPTYGMSVFGGKPFPGKRSLPDGPWRMHFGPRGFLKFFVLQLLKDERMSGYDLMKEIERRTFGAWRPTSGSIYPTLTDLESGGYIEEVRAKKGEAGLERGKRTYRITAKGKRRLAKWQSMREEMGRTMMRWRAFWREFYEPGLTDSLEELDLAVRRLKRSLPNVSKLPKEEADQIRSKIEELGKRLDRIIGSFKQRKKRRRGGRRS